MKPVGEKESQDSIAGGDGNPCRPGLPHAGQQGSSSTAGRRSVMAVMGFSSLALILFLLIFLPWVSWIGLEQRDVMADLYGATLWDWVRSTSAILALAALLSIRWPEPLDRFTQHWGQKLTRIPAASYAVIAALLMVIAGVVLAEALFSRNPHHVDSIAQLFQARIFAGGGLTAPAPDHLEFFNASQLVSHEGRWFSQYPPGHPVLLSLGLLAGAAWLVNPLFSAATVLLLFAIARRTLGDGSARLAVALYLISPFVLFMSASYMNHVTTGFFLVLALYAGLRAVDEGGRGGFAVVAGLALGTAAGIRPLEAAAWAAGLGIWMLARRAFRPVLMTAASCLAGLLPLLTYNALTTGAPLRFGYILLWGGEHGLGFHTDPWGVQFTPLISFAHTALDFQRLNDALFGLPFPSLIFAVCAFIFAARDRQERESIALPAALFLAAPAAYFFYWHRDNYLGPRFLYASLVPAILLTVAGIQALDRRLGRWRGVLRVTIAAGILYAVGVSLPARAGMIAGLEPEFKLHPEVEMRRQGVDSALVFVKVGWGNRLIARLWGWDVSASETERAFRVVDGCRLQYALDQADSLTAAGVDSADARAMLLERLRALRHMKLPVRAGVLPDHSVRVDTTMALSGRCYKEAARDASGYTLYASLVWRQDPWLEKGIVYARDMGPEMNGRLIDRFRGRPWYLYAPPSPQRGAVPVLTPLRPSGE